MNRPLLFLLALAVACVAASGCDKIACRRYCEACAPDSAVDECKDECEDDIADETLACKIAFRSLGRCVDREGCNDSCSSEAEEVDDLCD